MMTQRSPISKLPDRGAQLDIVDAVITVASCPRLVPFRENGRDEEIVCEQIGRQDRDA